MAPWAIRSTPADRATPIRRLSRTTPAAPAAAANHATELTGPMSAAAWSVSPSVSDRRIGKRLSKVTIAKPQNSSTATRAASTRDPRRSPIPSPTMPGTARTEVATAPTPSGIRISRIRTRIADEVDDAERQRHQQRQGQGRDGGDRVERDERARDERPDRDGEAQDRRAGAQAVLDLGVRVGGQRGVDIPRLERPAVERPEDALEHRRGREQHDRIGDVQESRARRVRRGSRGSARAVDRARPTGRRSAARGSARRDPAG